MKFTIVNFEYKKPHSVATIEYSGRRWFGRKFRFIRRYFGSCTIWNDTETGADPGAYGMSPFLYYSVTKALLAAERLADHRSRAS